MVTALLAIVAFQPDPGALRRIFEDALARRRAEYGEADGRTAQAARDLGLFLGREGDVTGAAGALAEAVAADEKAFGPAAKETLSDTAELASVTPPARAEALWLRAAESPDPAVASRAYDALGSLREARGDRDGAAAFYKKALAKEESASGPAGARVAVRLNSLALTLEPREGLPLLRRALAIDRAVYGARHPETATTEANLCGLLLATGRAQDAVSMGTAAVAAFEATLGDHPRTASAASNLADAQRAAGNRAEAERLYRRALAIDREAYGPEHEETRNDARNLAEFLREGKRAAEAVRVETEYRIPPAY